MVLPATPWYENPLYRKYNTPIYSTDNMTVDKALQSLDLELIIDRFRLNGGTPGGGMVEIPK